MMSTKFYHDVIDDIHDFHINSKLANPVMREQFRRCLDSALTNSNGIVSNHNEQKTSILTHDGNIFEQKGAPSFRR